MLNKNFYYINNEYIITVLLFLVFLLFCNFIKMTDVLSDTFYWVKSDNEWIKQKFSSEEIKKIILRLL